jgi:hypothetical protein
MNGARLAGAMAMAPFVIALVGLATWWCGGKLRARLQRTAKGSNHE